MRRALAAAIATTMLYAHLAHAESYLCVADSAAGFVYSKTSKRWTSTTFKSVEKYLLVRPTEAEKVVFSGAWVLKEVGNDTPSAGCESEFGEAETLRCEGIYDFRFNCTSGRFLMAYLYGYWTDPPDKRTAALFGDEGTNTPYLQIGKCSRIP